MTKPHQKCDLKAVASDTRLNYLVWKGLWDNLTDDGFLCRKHPRCEEDNPSWWWVPSNPSSVYKQRRLMKPNPSPPTSQLHCILFTWNCRGRGGARSSPICPDLPQVPPPRPPSTQGLYQVNIPFFFPFHRPLTLHCQDPLESLFWAADDDRDHDQLRYLGDVPALRRFRILRQEMSDTEGETENFKNLDFGGSGMSSNIYLVLKIMLQRWLMTWSTSTSSARWSSRWLPWVWWAEAATFRFFTLSYQRSLLVITFLSKFHDIGSQIQQTAGDLEQAGLLHRDIWVRKIPKTALASPVLRC